MIFCQLDIQSLFNCRRISLAAMCIINGLQEYHGLIHLVPNAVRCALSIEAGSYITCETLHNAVFENRCSDENCDGPMRRSNPCDSPARFLCVLTGRRFCLRHLSLVNRRDRNLPLFAQEAEDVYGLAAHQIADLPSFKSLPGHYSPNDHVCRGRFHFVDGASVYARAVEIHGSRKALREHQRLRLLEGLLSNRVLLPSKYKDTYLSSMPDYVLQNFVRNRSCLPLSWNLGRLRSRRFMTVVLAPLIDRCERVPRWGRYCVSCQAYDFECWDIHTLDSMEEHLLQHESGGGFRKRIPLDFCRTWDRELQFNGLAVCGETSRVEVGQINSSTCRILDA